MAGKQFADKEFLTQYSSYLKEHTLDPIAKAIDSDGTHPDAALHLPPYWDEPYFVMTSADGMKSIQLMTNGSWGGRDSDGVGMGLRFQSFDGNAAYGNIALKADPSHGWDYVLTLPTETGTLATRNYVDDQLSDATSNMQTQINSLKSKTANQSASGTTTSFSGGVNVCGESLKIDEESLSHNISFKAGDQVYWLNANTGEHNGNNSNSFLVTDKYVQNQLSGKASTSHTHSASDITSGTLSSVRLPTVPARSKVSGIIVTNAYSNSSSVRNPVYFAVGDSGTSFYIMSGRLTVSSGSSPRTVNVTLPISLKHIYTPVICESTGGGASQTQYYNAVRAGNGSGIGAGSYYVSSFQVQVGLDEKCYVNWMVLGDTR